MKVMLLTILALAGFGIPRSEAAMVRYNFSGAVTSVQNQQQVMWDAEALLGSAVTGWIELDTSVELWGSLETSWYWWVNNDYGPGALSSQVSFGRYTYELSPDYDYHPDFGFLTNEYIEVTNGPAFDEVPIGDRLNLVDSERRVVPEEMSVNQSSSLEIRFLDYVHDFLHFPDGLSEETPNLQQEFIWSDMDLDDPDQSGTGSFSFSRRADESAGLAGIDSQLDFVLTEVSSTLVTENIPEPAPLGLLGLGLLLMYCVRFNERPGR